MGVTIFRYSLRPVLCAVDATGSRRRTPRTAPPYLYFPLLSAFRFPLPDILPEVLVSNTSLSSPVWRKILGVVLGLCAGITIIALLQALGHKFWPLPAGIDVTDKAALAEVLKRAPVGALLWVALSWFAGTALGAYIALRVARDAWTTWPAVTVEAVLLAAGVMNLMALPHPGWFWVVGLASFPLGAFSGIRLARRGTA
jgi:hypothetical protein